MGNRFPLLRSRKTVNHAKLICLNWTEKETMKRYYSVNPETGAISDYYVGHTSDIKALYKAICRASRKGNTFMYPFFCDFPVFSPNKEIYALCVDTGNDWNVTIINSDTMLSMIVDGFVKEI